MKALLLLNMSSIPQLNVGINQNHYAQLSFAQNWAKGRGRTGNKGWKVAAFPTLLKMIVVVITTHDHVMERASWLSLNNRPVLGLGEIILRGNKAWTLYIILFYQLSWSLENQTKSKKMVTYSFLQCEQFLPGKPWAAQLHLEAWFV